jgi:putative membrane protein
MTRPQTIALSVVCGGAFLLGQAAFAQSSTSDKDTGNTSSTSSAQSSSSSRGGSADTGKSASDRSSNAGQSSSSLSSADQKFAKMAAEGSQAEIKFAQLAQQKSSDQQTKDFANQIITDHTKASDQLKPIAQQKGITLPDQMNSKDQAEYDRLSKLSGDAFDKAYFRFMTRDHRKDVAEFKREAQNGTDPDLKSFASETLPTLEHHLQMAENNRQREAGSSASSSRRDRGTMGTDNTSNPDTGMGTDNPNRRNPNNPNNPSNPNSNPSQNPNRNPY